MPIAVAYEHDNRICVVTFTGLLDLVDYADVVRREHRAVFDKATRPIHTILDLTGLRLHGIPKNVLTDALRLNQMRHPMDGIAIIVTRDSIVTRFAEIFIRVLRSPRFTLCRSLDEAQLKIQAVIADEDQAAQA